MERLNREEPKKEKDPDRLSSQDWFLIKDYLEAFLQDLADLEAEGISHPDFERVGICFHTNRPSQYRTRI